jgi:hypothetical protein
MHHNNPALKASLAELDRLGLRATVEHRKKHLRISWETTDGRRATVGCGATPSDHRAGKNNVADIRRANRAYDSAVLIAAPPSGSQEEQKMSPSITNRRMRQAPNPPRSRERRLAVPINAAGNHSVTKTLGPALQAPGLTNNPAPQNEPQQDIRSIHAKWFARKYRARSRM